MAEIVSFRGGPIAQAPAAAIDADVALCREEMADMLREIIAKIEAGEIDGIAVAYTKTSDEISSRWHYGSANHRLIAATAYLTHCLLEDLRGTDDY